MSPVDLAAALLRERETLTSKRDVVVVLWLVDSVDLSTDVKLLDFVAEVLDGRVSRVIGTEDLLSFKRVVGLVNVLDWSRAKKENPPKTKINRPQKQPDLLAFCN
jgi:predicted GTPase